MFTLLLRKVLEAMKQSGIICFRDFVIIMQCCRLFVVIDNDADDAHTHKHTHIHSTDSKVCQDDSRMLNKIYIYKYIKYTKYTELLQYRILQQFHIQYYEPFSNVKNSSAE
jgi:hypothetical protein